MKAISMSLNQWASEYSNNTDNARFAVFRFIAKFVHVHRKESDFKDVEAEWNATSQLLVPRKHIHIPFKAPDVSLGVKKFLTVKFQFIVFHNAITCEIRVQSAHSHLYSSFNCCEQYNITLTKMLISLRLIKNKLPLLHRNQYMCVSARAFLLILFHSPFVDMKCAQCSCIQGKPIICSIARRTAITGLRCSPLCIDIISHCDA